MKSYLLKAIEKLFYLSISFKVHLFLIVFITTSFLAYYEKIDGNSYSVVVGVLIPAVVAGREISKKNIIDTIKEKIED